MFPFLGHGLEHLGPGHLQLGCGRGPLLLHQGLSSSLRVGLIRLRCEARRSAVFGSKQEVTDWNTWNLAAVLSSDLHGLLAPGAGLNKEGSVATDLRDILALPLVAN